MNYLAQAEIYTIHTTHALSHTFTYTRLQSARLHTCIYCVSYIPLWLQKMQQRCNIILIRPGQPVST